MQEVVPAGLTQVVRAAALIIMRSATSALVSLINCAIRCCTPGSNAKSGSSIMPVMEIPRSASRLAMRSDISPRYGKAGVVGLQGANNGGGASSFWRRWLRCEFTHIDFAQITKSPARFTVNLWP